MYTVLYKDEQVSMGLSSLILELDLKNCEIFCHLLIWEAQQGAQTSNRKGETPSHSPSSGYVLHITVQFFCFLTFSKPNQLVISNINTKNPSPCTDLQYIIHPSLMFQYVCDNFLTHSPVFLRILFNHAEASLKQEQNN